MSGYTVDIVTSNEYGPWEDLRFPSQNINPPGAVSDPDIDPDNGLWLFAAAGTEILFGVAQLPHHWVEGSTIYPHVHWHKSTSAAGNVWWQLDYEWVNQEGTYSGAYGSSSHSIILLAGTPDTNTAGKNLVTALDAVSGADRTISSLFFWKLSRVGGEATDTYGADCRMVEFDIHYMVDVNSMGSEDQYTKGF